MFVFVLTEYLPLNHSINLTWIMWGFVLIPFDSPLALHGDANDFQAVVLSVACQHCVISGISFTSHSPASVVTPGYVSPGHPPFVAVAAGDGDITAGFC